VRIGIIGDTHGNYGHYEAMVQRLYLNDEVDITVQLGDHGILCNQVPPLLKGVGETYPHKFFCGNHDDYKTVQGRPDFLGRYGIVVPQVFFVSGGYSPDYKNRTSGWDWVHYEELNSQEMETALSLYQETKPSIVITHEPPESLVNDLLEKSPVKHGFERRASRTGCLFDIMLKVHRPKVWYFGHYHFKYSNDIFHCVPIDDYIICSI
jgi:predicted phosphodiesterase